jgi:PAS domain S-box-containing protein
MDDGGDAIWRQAPHPALRLWHSGARCEPNDAARAWADTIGLDAPPWAALAEAVRAAPQQGHWPLGSHAVDGRLVTLADGALLWWAAPQVPLQQALTRLGATVWRLDLARGHMAFDPHAARPPGMADDAARAGLAIVDARAGVHPDDRAEIEQAADEALRSGRPVDAIARWRAGDGRWVALWSRRVAERDTSGRATALLGLLLDVEHFVAERERFSELASAAGLGLWSRTGPPGSAVWNEAMYRIYRRTRADGVPSLDEWYGRIVHPADAARFRADQEACEAEWRPTFQTEFRVRTPDGRPRWIYAWSRRGERDGRRYAFGLHLDITERRLAQIELERERERALFAVEAAGIGLWRRSLDRKTVFWNPTMYRLRGLDPADPRPVTELTMASVHPDDAHVLRELSQRLVPGGLPYEREYRVVWPDGSVHWLATRGRLVEDDDGPYMTGINVDVTERRSAEALRRERDRLEQSRQAQSAFLARVSHELRTPLNAVLGFAQLLGFESDEPLSPRQAERVQRIETAGRHLLALIDDVLDLARIEAEPPPAACVPVALDAVAREALGWVAAQARQAAVVLRIAPEALAGQVAADRRRLGQIAVNLLTNAIKYNRPGGEVEVTTRSEGTRCALVVRDTGRGMTAEQVARAFEPFERLGAENEDIEGTGIGLAIVHQLVQRLGGEVRVSSEPGVGSEFAVWLPAADGASTPAPPLAAPAPAAPAHALRVLCIDDHPANLQLVQDLLRLRPGTRFEGAATGRAGLAAALAQPPDVVLLDMQLPDLHGSEVLRCMRAEPALARCKVIALSANAMPADVATALAQGFDDYWTKPIDARRFLAGIDALGSAAP